MTTQVSEGRPTDARSLGIGGHHSPVSMKDEWLTPPRILQALGGADSFDLDPCAPVERPWPTAKKHYTIQDNGLRKPWSGRIFLNPPYGAPKVIGPWLRRMAAHGCGVALTFARTETGIFHETIWEAATAALFLRGRLFFFDVAGREADHNAGAPSVLAAYGVDDASRLEACGIIGKFVRLR